MKNNIPRYKKFTRSKVGNFIFFAILIIAGLYTVLPLIYSVITSFKPLDELLAFPPKFYVVRPTFKNYAILPELLSNLEVPFSRYVFNTVFLSAVITFLHVIIASMSAFVMCQVKNKWTLILFMTVQFALLYNATTLAVPQYLIFSKAVTNLSFTCHFSSTGRNPSSFSATSRKMRSVAVRLYTNPFSSRFLKNGFGLWYFRPQFSQYSLYLS